ncbi:methyl-accepting chemotaxis protein [uncultured Cohaesibacter sp.]|uniref:methyl-accepting chemotaxis protein n=1 Tax=uncultured Cohaesibacter sp. TaxID=1002546 RepID=UPI0029C677C6|nr:methyl-accepting chemotaxis protein [uncultured Cohaesibacter sp.]
MSKLRSLSIKIIATVFTLVAFAFVADTLLNQSISRNVHQSTEALSKQMRSVVTEKDSQIQTLLTGLLDSKAESQQLGHALASHQLKAVGQHKEAYLDGERYGISMSVASLVRASMMSGEAETALDQIDTLLENDQIATINIWRESGELAFRDNKTIDAVNTFVESDAFEKRDVEEALTIPANRLEILKQAMSKDSNHESLETELKDDDGNTIPVSYSYFILKNDEDCQSCHDPAQSVRGILEVAVPNAELLALRAKSEEQIKALTETLEAEQASLIAKSDAQKAEVETQTQNYNAALDQAKAELDNTRETASWMGLASKAAFFLLTIGLLMAALGKLLTRPLQHLTSIMLRLAENDMTVEADGLDRQDEIGAMSRAVAIFKDNALDRQKLETESKQHMQQQLQRQETIDALFSDFRSRIQHSLETVSTRASTMQASAVALNNISSATSEQARAADAASSSSADSVQTMAAASTEMTASIAEIGQQVVRTNDLVSAATEEAQNTDQKVAGLANAAEHIGEVVSLIRDIAEQTNLLALNATIEAARAGEAGKGFAVVAAEVKNLANQTSKATEDIETRIQAIQASSTDSMDAIRAIATKMGEISEFTTAISAAVHEQNISTSEISHNIHEAADRTQEIVGNISAVAQSAQQTLASSHEVESASQTVAEVAEDMRTVIDDFLKKVAAA